MAMTMTTTMMKVVMGMQMARRRTRVIRPHKTKIMRGVARGKIVEETSTWFHEVEVTMAKDIEGPALSSLNIALPVREWIALAATSVTTMIPSDAS